MTTITRAKLIREDQALYDGKTSTFSRLDATGGTKTGLRINDFVDVLQVFGEGTNRTRATIANAINGIGSTVCTLKFAPGTWTIDSSLTIPSTMSVIISGGCVFDITGTLTFAGPVHVEYVTSTGTGWYTGTVSCSQGATGFPGW